LGIYRLLVDHFVNGVFLQAGSLVSDTGGGAQLPNGYIPTLGMDPQDGDAINKFWAAGPAAQQSAEKSLSLGPWGLQSRWSNAVVAAPAIYWQPAGPGQFILTGAGASLGPRNPPGGAAA
jgi:hypothetical protein